ncbi:hypothetical protein CLAFUW4_01404 [Fulvia fulva]|uniref:Uncharacterized protein n=1 Tax=Passalora fulva TaxID=5499 RepID=A0A9Q8L732_PASFU|nr:uncharacterized protein CLAFUR5_01406 [Fulvia fulva]KAK4635286.1 hypothetical protein CLAFUR4_01405 [Fulvia fulva]KAK4638453.1 hypothetical protein CLAFUR0_01406 [Fulvia fulva]UJO12111.1 hypothetical protein CLAFUR5_01406 [Fulvia fulva]WPV09236.1 hypothetical protein CLAFUW4_01404 [Fulvia fulva]WPV23981.1 hypothetical protein CLAFUW7_01409 [Fulvia fulva]
MLRILTTVTLCFAVGFAQFDNETEEPAPQGDDEVYTITSTATATATATYTGGSGLLNLPPGSVALVPATERSDSELYVPTTTATPSPHEPASSSYEPDTTTEYYEPSSTVYYYEPTTTQPSYSTWNRKPIVESTGTELDYPVYSETSSYADYTGPYAPDVVRTESSDDSLAMPTPSSSKQYHPPPQPTKESPPPPAFTYAPTTPYESPAQQTTPIAYAPSSQHETYPPAETTPVYVAPIPVSSSDTENSPITAYHSTAAPAVPATPATPSVSKQTIYVQPAPVSQPGTLTSKIVPTYSDSMPEHTTEGALTYDHAATSTSAEHVMTYKGHTISLGGATLAALPTGSMPEGGRASPSGYASQQTGAGVKIGGLGCASLAAVFGAVLLLV